MKITNKTKNVARGLTGIFAGLLAISIGATSVVETYRSWIDAQLGTVSSGIVTDEVDPNEDTYNFRVKSADEVGGFDLTTSKGVYDYQKAAAIEIASEGIVLMKNDDSLPLAKNSNVTLLGTAAYNVFHGGTMGSMPVQSEKISFVDALTDQGMTVDPTAMAAYENAPGYGESTTQLPWGTTVNSNLSSISSGVFTLNESSPADVGLSNLSQKGGTAIVVLARQGGEQSYYLPGEEGKGNTDINSWDEDHDVLGLSVKEMETIKYAKANYDNVVVIINSDSAMDVPELFEDGGEYEADSVLWAGLPGTYGWVAVAQVLDGTVNPSGHMVDTYAAKASVSAANQNYGIFTFANADLNDALVTGSEKSAWYMPEAEGIYIGYRYYETRYFDAVMGQGNATVAHKGANQDTADPDAASWNYSDEVVASFGYGLSYTTFTETLDSVDVDFDAQTVTATVTVQNTGSVPGKHAVQLYVNTPYTAGGLEKSAIALLGYEKTGMLGQGESETVTITAEFQDFATYDSELAHHNTQGGYVLDEGDYIFSIGNGAHDALNNVLDSLNKGTSDGMDYAGNRTKTETVEFDRVELLFSKSGELIENQLQDMELSNFDEEIVELSRQDWDRYWVETYSELNYTKAMENGLKCMIYEIHETDNDGNEVVWGADTEYTFAGLKPEKGEWMEYDDPRLLALVQQVTLEEAIQCVTQCGGQDFDAIPSIQSPAFKTTDGPVGYDAERGKLSIDWNTANTEYDTEEGDPYGDIEMRPLPTMPVIGATFSHEMAEKSGEVLSMLALWSGVAEVWGPGVNIHRTPYNSRNHEYYSEDPVHLAAMANDFATEAQANGLITCLKHFAFNDTEANRSGIAPFMSEQRARELDLRAFQKAIENETALAVMTGFNRAGATFCSAHTGLITGILREEWGFNGFCLTDMVSPAYYMNPRDSIAAGTDGMLTSSSTSNIQNNVNGWGEFTPEGLAEDMDMQQRIQDSIHRALYIFINSNATNGYSANSHLEFFRTWYDNALTALITVTAVLTGVSAAGYIATKVLLKKKEDTTEVKDEG